MSPLPGTKHTHVRLAIIIHCQILAFFQVCEWHITQLGLLMWYKTDCHHHFDASGTSNAMFDELAERSLMSPLAGTKNTYVRLAIIIHCKILAFFQVWKNLTEQNVNLPLQKASFVRSALVTWIWVSGNTWLLLHEAFLRITAIVLSEFQPFM